MKCQSCGADLTETDAVEFSLTRAITKVETGHFDRDRTNVFIPDNYGGELDADYGTATCVCGECGEAVGILHGCPVLVGGED